MEDLPPPSDVPPQPTSLELNEYPSAAQSSLTYSDVPNLISSYPQQSYQYPYYSYYQYQHPYYSHGHHQSVPLAQDMTGPQSHMTSRLSSASYFKPTPRSSSTISQPLSSGQQCDTNYIRVFVPYFDETGKSTLVSAIAQSNAIFIGGLPSSTLPPSPGLSANKSRQLSKPIIAKPIPQRGDGPASTRSGTGAPSSITNSSASPFLPTPQPRSRTFAKPSPPTSVEPPALVLAHQQRQQRDSEFSHEITVQEQSSIANVPTRPSNEKIQSLSMSRWCVNDEIPPQGCRRGSPSQNQLLDTLSKRRRRRLARLIDAYKDAALGNDEPARRTAILAFKKFYYDSKDHRMTLKRRVSRYPDQMRQIVNELQIPELLAVCETKGMKPRNRGGLFELPVPTQAPPTPAEMTVS